MTFIIVFISLLIERFFHWNHLRHWRWFTTYQHWLSLRLTKWPSYFSLAISLLLPLVVVGLINCALSGWLYDLFKLIFGVLVLTYCLGPDNLWVQTYRCLTETQKEDPSAAMECLKTEFRVAHSENSQAFHQTFTRAIFVAANERIFAVLFWFAILGPVGALLYRLTALSANPLSIGASYAVQLRCLLDWLPARLFTFIFALGGHFTEVMANWKKDAVQGLSGNEKLLADCGVAALDGVKGNHLAEDGSAEKDALALLDRVFVIMMVILAVVVLLMS